MEQLPEVIMLFSLSRELVLRCTPSLSFHCKPKEKN